MNTALLRSGWIISHSWSKTLYVFYMSYKSYSLAVVIALVLAICDHWPQLFLFFPNGSFPQSHICFFHMHAQISTVLNTQRGPLINLSALWSLDTALWLLTTLVLWAFRFVFPAQGVFWSPPDPPALLCPENSLGTLRWGNFMSPLIHFPSHRDPFLIPLFIVWCPISSNNYLVCTVYIFSLCRKVFMVPLSWLETEILYSLDFLVP